MFTKMRRRTCSLALGLLVLLLAVFAVACGGEQETTTTATLETTTTVTLETTTTVTLSEAEAIAANWETFFDPATSAAEKLALLENGAAHRTELDAWVANPAAAGVSVQVTDVKVNADGTAAITFDVLSGGATVLTGETGTAVLEDGSWKVSESSFAGMLAAMGGGGGGTGTPATD